jgi:hypothetical protein
MINLDICGDSGTGRLVLNENHRNEITHFHDKTIADFVEIKKKLIESCKVLERQRNLLK